MEYLIEKNGIFPITVFAYSLCLAYKKRYFLFVYRNFSFRSIMKIPLNLLDFLLTHTYIEKKRKKIF